MKTVEQRWIEVKGAGSGFDYLRIVLATSVVIWHGVAVAYGNDAAINVWNNWPGLILQLILPCFFALSGFLVAGSKFRTPSLPKFLTLRVIRLFPALAIEVVLSAFLLGPLLTTFPLHQYFTDRYFFSYLANMIGWVHFLLPGVFVNNTFPGTVNAPLWTLPFELESYLLLSCLVLIGAFQRGRRILVLFVLVTVGVAIYSISKEIDGASDGRVLVLCFFAGLLIFIYRDSIPYNFPTAVGAALLAVVLLRFSYAVYLAPLPAAYLTVYVGLLNPRRTIIISSGDYSYGTYIYAFPIQQTVALLSGSLNSWGLNVAVALPITIIFALCSWHLVEKPFQRLKYIVAPKRAVAVAS